nr:hypothetical protein [Tanacetum cinerariifolium]
SERVRSFDQQKNNIQAQQKKKMVMTSLLKSSKDLENLIESQRSEKIKDGLGYSAVPPPIAQIYSSPKKDLSWTGLSECAGDTVTDYTMRNIVIEE